MTEIPEQRLIGTGWAAPVRVGGHGGIELVSGHREIEEAIAVILSTSPGERVMRPAFGCRIHELVFAPQNSETIGLAARYIREALGRWEPRIDVADIEIEVGDDIDGRPVVLATVSYSIRATKDERSLVYPFYIIEHEER